MNGDNRLASEGGVARSNKNGRDQDLFAHALYLREGRTRTPLSLVLVNTHMLSEIVVATERLIATRECTRKGFLVGVDASNVPLKVFTPSETFSAIGYDADERSSGFVAAILNGWAWDRRDAPPTALLGQIGNWNWSGLPTTAFLPRGHGDGQGDLRL